MSSPSRLRLAIFARRVTTPRGPQHVPPGADAEDHERSARARPNRDGLSERAWQRRQRDVRAGQRIAGFVIQDDAFHHGRVNADREQQYGEWPHLLFMTKRAAERAEKSARLPVHRLAGFKLPDFGCRSELLERIGTSGQRRERSEMHGVDGLYF